MQYLMFVTILAVTTGTFLASIHAAPFGLKYAPEALSVVLLIYIAVAGARTRFRYVAPRYWLVLGALAIVVASGVLINSIAPGPLLEGCRFYLRAMPLFLLPAVFDFSDSHIRAQLRLLLGISLVQLPLSIYQRYQVMAAFRMSGDPVFGTLMISSIESIFLIAGICIAAALVLRDRMSRPVFVCLFILLFIPTTINETKATLFLLPIGLLLTLLLGSEPRNRMRVAISGIALLSVFGAVFVPVYDYFAITNNPYPYTLERFFTNEKAVAHYVDRDAGVGSRIEVGRVDSLVVPLQHFATDPVHLMLGVGVGNSSYSSLGPGYAGAYFSLLGRYTDCTAAAQFLVEIGVVGTALVLLLYWLIFLDSIAVASRDGSLLGALALAWVGVTAVIAVATFYKNIVGFESLSYLFWYVSGLITARRTRLALGTAAAQTRPVLSLSPGVRA
jgi:hypothetical protein